MNAFSIPLDSAGFLKRCKKRKTEVASKRFPVHLRFLFSAEFFGWLERSAAIAAATGGSRMKNILHKYEEMHNYEDMKFSWIFKTMQKKKNGGSEETVSSPSPFFIFS
jgi:hypothetical protein